MSEKNDDKTNFYLSGRQEWMERYGSYIKQAKNWRLMAFGSMAIAGIFAVGMVYEANRVHNIPYVFEVNRLGQSVELGQAVQSGSFNQPVVRHIVSSFTRKRKFSKTFTRYWLRFFWTGEFFCWHSGFSLLSKSYLRIDFS